RPAPVVPHTSGRTSSEGGDGDRTGTPRRRRRRGGRGRSGGGGGGARQPVEAIVGGTLGELGDGVRECRRVREREGRPVGRYLMCVHVRPQATQIAVL